MNTYQTKPKQVTAFQYTKDNEAAIMEWGKDRKIGNGQTSIITIYEFIDGSGIIRESGQHRIGISTIQGRKSVFIGQWIVIDGNGIKVISDNEFKNQYDEQSK